MAFSLTPTDTGFYELFARSAVHLVEGTRQLTALLGARDDDERRAVAERMSEIEVRAAEAAHEIVRKVNTSFFTPFDREDIHALAVAIDACVDHMDAAVDLATLYRIESFPQGVAELVEVLTRMAGCTADAMPRLRATKTLDGYWIEVNRLENRADKTYRRVLAALVNAKDADAIAVLKHKEVIDELEAAANAFEQVAQRIESIAVKEF